MQKERSGGLDTPPALHAEQVAIASQLLDEAYILAAEIAETESDETLSLEMFKRMEYIIDGLQPLNVRYCIMGEGFYPLDLPDGDVCTVYGATPRIMGAKFVGLDLADADEFDYKSRTEITNYIDDFVTEDEDDTSDGALLEIGGSYLDCIAQVSTPPDEIRLFARFAIYFADDEDREIAGSSVVAHTLGTYAIMDLVNLVVEQIESPDEFPEHINKMNVSDHLVEHSQKTRAMIRSTGFRRLSADDQDRMLTTQVLNANSSLAINRFSVYVHAEKMPSVFYPVLVDGEQVMEELVFDEHHVSGFIVDLDTVDSIELYRMGQGNRIPNDATQFDSRSGLWLVGRIQPHIANELGLPTNVVWLPVNAAKPKEQKADRRTRRHLERVLGMSIPKNVGTPFKALFFDR